MAMIVKDKILEIYVAESDVKPKNRLKASKTSGSMTCSYCPPENKISGQYDAFYDFLGKGRYISYDGTKSNDYVDFREFRKSNKDFGAGVRRNDKFIFDKKPVFFSLSKTKKHFFDRVSKEIDSLKLMYANGMSTFESDFKKLESIGDHEFKVADYLYLTANRPYLQFEGNDAWNTVFDLIYSQITCIVVESKSNQFVVYLKFKPPFSNKIEEEMDIKFDWNVYGIHMTNRNDAFREDFPHISIGWSTLGDLTNIKEKEELSNLYKSKVPDASYKAMAQDVGQIWRFINEAKIGDYIVYGDGSKFHIGKIVSDYLYRRDVGENQDADYVNTRQVKWIKTDLNKNVLSQQIRNSIGASMSFFKLNDYKSAINDLINDQYTKDEDELDEFMKEETVDNADEFKEIIYKTGYVSSHPRNLIYFGAPGTGKSYAMNRDSIALLSSLSIPSNHFERVTFHPDYTYANFVGTYKPISTKSGIDYKFVPGPFIRLYVRAIKSGRESLKEPFLLMIEEINRANTAAVFGDIFQLLDRDNDGVSQYSINVAEDVKNYLAETLGGNPNDYSQIKLPDNLFIWATMNSADQGVFPIDTAFKRRWDFLYIGINNNESDISSYKFSLGEGENAIDINWNQLRKAINTFLSNKNINEDKLLGPFFISQTKLSKKEDFIESFKSKVLMYLFEDAAKQIRSKLFAGCENFNQYSEICKQFDKLGVGIFSEEIANVFKPRT